MVSRQGRITFDRSGVEPRRHLAMAARLLELLRVLRYPYASQLENDAAFRSERIDLLRAAGGGHSERQRARRAVRAWLLAKDRWEPGLPGL